jgi:hypothetical protein
MRIHLLALALLAGAAVPAVAQTRAETPEKRIERLEQELRAVQRKVFQGGAYVTPEVTPGAPRPPPSRKAFRPPRRSPTSPPASTRWRRSFAS